MSITIAGWFFLLGGLFRLLFPEAQQGNENTPAVAAYVLDVVMVCLGALMTVKALGSRQRRGDVRAERPGTIDTRADRVSSRM